MIQNIFNSLRKIKQNWVWSRAAMFPIAGNVTTEST